jgi:hypothetical protein
MNYLMRDRYRMHGRTRQSFHGGLACMPWKRDEHWHLVPSFTSPLQWPTIKRERERERERERALLGHAAILVWQEWSHACDALLCFVGHKEGRRGEGDSVPAAVAVVTTRRAMQAGWVTCACMRVCAKWRAESFLHWCGTHVYDQDGLTRRWILHRLKLN